MSPARRPGTRRRPTAGPFTVLGGFDVEALFRDSFARMSLHLALFEAVPGPSGEPVDLAIVAANAATAETLGVPLAEAAGKRLLELQPDYPRPIVDRLLAVARTGASDYVVHEVGDGRTFRAVFSCPGPGLVAVMGRDCTEERNAAKALAERERELREVQRVAKVGSWSRDLAAGVSTWSDETYRILGVDPSGPVPPRSALPQFLGPESLQRVTVALEAAVRDGTPYELELDVHRADGTSGTIIARGEGVRDASGRVAKLRGTVVDVTGHARLQRELGALREQLAHVARVATLGELVSSLAHELSQPLAAILANAEAAARMLRQARGPAPDPFSEAVADIARDAGRATEVIGRLRAHLRRGVPGTERLDVNALVREVVPLAAVEARRRAATIDLQLAASLPAVQGDGIQLQQVLLNLLLNALDAVAGKPEPRRVTVRSRADGASARVEVCDSGPGVPAGAGERVFEPFFTTKPGGLGIGLPSSRTIVEVHGGTLRLVESGPGGAVFAVTLPAAPGAGRNG